MKFAHLVRFEKTTQTQLVPQQGSSFDATGLLKARTWLAYLTMEERLQPKRFAASADWVEYSAEDSATPILVDLIEPDVVAVIPYIPFLPYNEQPGLALVRNDVEVQMLFNSVYVRASISYLHRHPHIIQQIKDRESKK